MSEINYFDARRINPDFYENFQIPKYLLPYLPQDRSAKILDFGCGFGQMMKALINHGYTHVFGCDLDKTAIEFCLRSGLKVEDCSDMDSFVKNYKGYFDFIIMSHVLEHIPKDKIIETLSKIRALLNDDGGIFIMVPNAQSPVACYWAYEDFTHTTLFTAGSLYYVLKMAGYKDIVFVDPMCLERLSFWKRLIRKMFYKLYDLKTEFWNLMTCSSFHKPSPKIYSWEIKVFAR